MFDTARDVLEWARHGAVRWMAETQGDEEIEGVNEQVLMGSDPENDSTGLAGWFGEMADRTLKEHFTKVLDTIVVNVEAKHLPSAKFLVDLAVWAQKYPGVKQERFVSLAQTLWEDLQKTTEIEGQTVAVEVVK